MIRRFQIRLLSFILKYGLRLMKHVAIALGKLLPGPLPVFTPPPVDPADMEDGR
jgi:hypothetical protein